MSAANWMQLIVYLGVLFALAPFLGKFMARVYGDEKHILSFLKPLERGIYKISGIDPRQQMNWKQYAGALLALNILGFLFLYLLLVTQKWLPLNPAKIDNMSWHLALNTAVSFMTNTNWQNYGGENAASYLSQMAGLPCRTSSAPQRAWRRCSYWFGASSTSRERHLQPSAGGNEPGPSGQLLGRPHTVHSLHPSAAFHHPRGAPDVAGGHPDVRRPCPRGHAGREGPGHYAGTRRVADRNQAARDKRGRFFQRQLRVSIRKPHASFQPVRDAGHSPDPRSHAVCLRTNGERQEPGPRPVCGKDRALRHRSRGDPLCRIRLQRNDRRSRHHGGKGNAVRDCRQRPVGRSHNGDVQRLGQLDA